MDGEDAAGAEGSLESSLMIEGATGVFSRTEMEGFEIKSDVSSTPEEEGDASCERDERRTPRDEWSPEMAFWLAKLRFGREASRELRLIEPPSSVLAVERLLPEEV